MDELDDDRHGNVLGTPVTAGACGQQHRERAQSLATAVDDVVSHLVDQGDITAQSLENQSVDSGPVVVYEGSERFQRRCAKVGFGGLHRAHNARYETVWRDCLPIPYRAREY